ncbi:MAG TPA: hypothetical protein DCE14_04840 [Kosmotogaceae bacterium]|nr:MAG: Uncharacterized protein XE05_0555 [Thermotogales bacterium 46_20]HAA85665.1 hypothetical protein [Kosmotogaceae bacterium]
MIFVLSLLMWLGLSSSLNITDIVSAIVVSSAVEVISRRVIPRGKGISALMQIILAFPRAVCAAVRMIVSRPLFTSREKGVSSDRLSEFAEVVSITMIPDELVVLKEDGKHVIHGVKKWR